MFNPIDEVNRVKKSSMMLLKRVSISNKNEYCKLDGYLKYLNLDKKNKWKSIKANENNFEKKYKKFQLDVSKVKTNLTENEIKHLSLSTLPRHSSSTKTYKSGQSIGQLTRKSAVPTNITKFTINLDEDINEVARTNHVVFIDDELIENQDKIQLENENNTCDYTEQINCKLTASKNKNKFNYAKYYFNRLNTSGSIQPEKKQIKINDLTLRVNLHNFSHDEDRVSIALPSITTIKSAFQSQNLDSFYSTQLDDFNESNYFQNLIEKRFAYNIKAKQMNKYKFSCHYN